MDDAKTQLANRLKQANNVLVSVANNPTVDQFAAAIALTLMLNKLGKHATTVFSGTTPSLVEFLQPEKVVEKNTDSLRDFIISLDKSKADKLRYKIEDNFVKIFITPYHSSISEKDLVFSQGDFNVDVVVGLGVHRREELDQAIVAHGRILHDATVTTVNTQPPSTLGTINWSENNSSSICEMLVSLSDLLAKQGLLDTQISNALLTGIVAETQRFSNKKTTAVTMSSSSKLLASGANQQLVATQLTPKPAQPTPQQPLQSHVSMKLPTNESAPTTPHPSPPPPPKHQEDKPPQKPDNGLPKQLVSAEKPEKKKSEFGVLEITHDEDGAPTVTTDEVVEQVAQVSIDDQGTLMTIDPGESDKNKPSDDHGQNNQAQSPPPPVSNSPAEQSVTPPNPTGTLPPQQTHPTVDSTAYEDHSGDHSSSNGQALAPPPTDAQLSTDGFGNISDGNFSKPPEAAAVNSEEDDESSPSTSPSIPLMSHNSASDWSSATDLSEVRNAVNNALSSSPPNIANQPLASLNSQEVGLNMNPQRSTSAANEQSEVSQQGSLPPIAEPPKHSQDSQNAQESDHSSAPPVPPPIVPIDNNNNMPPSYTAL